MRNQNHIIFASILKELKLNSSTRSKFSDCILKLKSGKDHFPNTI
uniref:Uncharacterized protein n=1 Tax=Romanomermis culicivorax TaxID=13658 RepID=A0A915KUS0_ROMCU